MINTNGNYSRPLKAQGILISIILCLVVAHLALSTFFPNPVINGLGIFLLGLILFYVLHTRRDVFGFILIIFAVSHFAYADNQGGLFNVLAFALVLLYLLRFRIRETIKHDVIITTLIWVLLIHNILGWILINPAPYGIVMLGAITFFGYILMFYVASRIALTKERLKKLLIIICVVVIYNFMVSLNHTYSVLKIVTPLLALNENLLYRSTNAFGVFGNSSVNGEYNLFIFVFLIPLSGHSLLRRELNIWPVFLTLVALLCLATIILSNTRGSTILAALAIVFYGFLFSVVYRRSKGVLKNLNVILVLCALGLILYGSYLGLSSLQDDFQTVGTLDKESILSGKALNRFGVWQLAWERLSSQSWALGYGHGVPASNWIAWGGSEYSGDVHLHSLYMALPMIHGWGGFVTLMLLFLVTIKRLFGVVKSQDTSHYLVAVCLGFLVAWSVFLVEEVKSGVMVQEPHYQMIVWIFLGLSHAAINTLKAEILQSRRTSITTGIKPFPRKTMLQHSG